MHSKEADTSLSDRESRLVEQVAQARGITLEEAASQLLSEAIAKRFRKKLGKAPANVYQIRRKS